MIFQFETFPVLYIIIIIINLNPVKLDDEETYYEDLEIEGDEGHHEVEDDEYGDYENDEYEYDEEDNCDDNCPLEGEELCAGLESSDDENDQATFINDCWFAYFQCVSLLFAQDWVVKHSGKCEFTSQELSVEEDLSDALAYRDLYPSEEHDKQNESQKEDDDYGDSNHLSEEDPSQYTDV